MIYNICNSNGRFTTIALLFFFITTTTVFAQTNSTKSCSPSSCSTICNPTCSSSQTCILKTMTECGVCPQAVCITTGVVGTTTAAPSSSSSSSNDTGAIIGGVVGGLVGLGILVGIVVYCYLKKHKRVNGKLPFAFTSSNPMPRVVQQEKPPAATTPHPAVIAALAHQNDRLSQTYNNNTNRQSVHSLNEMKPETGEEDEFEKRIALQNKRISEILLGNPRLSYQPPQQQTLRSSYYTTDEESDMDDRKSVSTVDSAAVVRTATPQSSVAVVQVVRAKPQIMRVNSVRSTTNGGSGLSRNDSVRTVLTAITPSESSLALPTNKEEEEALFDFPTTPNNLSFVEEDDPFHDTHSIIPNTNEEEIYTIDNVNK